MDLAVPFKALSLSLHPFVTCFSLFGCVHKAIDCYTPGQVSFSVNRNKMALSFHWIMFFLKPRLVILSTTKSAETRCKVLITRNGERQSSYDCNNILL